MAVYNRREFMRRGAAGAAGLGLLLNGEPLAVEAASPLPKPAAPSDRVNAGFIGFGIRGNILFESARKTGQANLVEVCDCYKGHLERAKERTDGKIDTNYAEYKKLLDRKDIDAVVIATPDHWHAPLFLDAIAAGKDVYIEKPMTHRIADGQKMIDAARNANRIVQVGSQWISSSQNRVAKEMVSSGKLGKVTKVMAAYNRNSSTGAWNYPIPPDLENGVNFNWEEWREVRRKGPSQRNAFSNTASTGIIQEESPPICSSTSSLPSTLFWALPCRRTLWPRAASSSAMTAARCLTPSTPCSNIPRDST